MAELTYLVPRGTNAGSPTKYGPARAATVIKCSSNFHKKVVYVIGFLSSGGIFFSHSNINAGLVVTASMWIACAAALFYLNK
jgi:uncharacterized membrane protein YhiD involved in acid resistance